MIKLLTGQHIYEERAIACGYPRTWDDLLDFEQKQWNQTAKALNQDLGLCEHCGERPVSPNVLLEVAGDSVCSDCCNPPIDEHDPKVQHMHLFFNTDGTPAGVITPPAGMSLEEYKAKLTEDMSHMSFNLSFPGPEGAETATAKTLPELYDLMKEHLHVPADEMGYTYFIMVMRDDKIIGTGQYKRLPNGDMQIIKEEDAAEGLNDALYEYVFNHRA